MARTVVTADPNARRTAPGAVAIGALAFASLFPTAATWLWFVVLAGRPGMQVVYAAAKIVQFAFPALWATTGERHTRRASARSDAEAPPGRTDPVRVRRGIVAGLAFGIAVGAAILLAYALLFRGSAILGGGPAMIRAKVEDLGLATPARYVLLALFYSLVHSGLEEYYWRWFVFGRMRNFLRPGLAIAVSSLAFTAHHVVVLGFYFGEAWWMTLLGSAGVAAGGIVWAWLYERSGSLLGPWLSHLLIDAAIMAVGYDMLWPV